jgi:hypothetical protein
MEKIDELLTLNSKSAEFIKTTGIKNRYVHPYIPTMVIDNFYEDPDLWRHFALKQHFFKGDRGTWPGLRTNLLHDVNKDVFNVTMRKLLMVMSQYGFSHFDELQTAFQYIDKSYGRGWVHDDDPKLNIAGVIYLNKEAPIGSGTVIYQDSTDFNGEKYSKMFMNDVLFSAPEERDTYSKYRDEQISHFTKSITIESVYNRCIIFDPRCWHSAETFFGDDLESARLTQVFFIRAR